jgi:hypothetical protein
MFAFAENDMRAEEPMFRSPGDEFWQRRGDHEGVVEAFEVLVSMLPARNRSPCTKSTY